MAPERPRTKRYPIYQETSQAKRDAIRQRIYEQTLLRESAENTPGNAATAMDTSTGGEAETEALRRRLEEVDARVESLQTQKHKLFKLLKHVLNEESKKARENRTPSSSGPGRDSGMGGFGSPVPRFASLSSGGGRSGGGGGGASFPPPPPGMSPTSGMSTASFSATAGNPSTPRNPGSNALHVSTGPSGMRRGPSLIRSLNTSHGGYKPNTPLSSLRSPPPYSSSPNIPPSTPTTTTTTTTASTPGMGSPAVGTPPTNSGVASFPPRPGTQLHTLHTRPGSGPNTPTTTPTSAGSMGSGSGMSAPAWPPQPGSQNYNSGGGGGGAQGRRRQSRWN